MNKAPKLRIICPTPGSRHIAEKLVASGQFDLELWQRPKTIAQGVRTGLSAGQPILAVCAIGILIRVLHGQDLGAKKHGLSIIAATEDGKILIPLLGGHAGTNRLAKHLARILGGTAILTTASDQTFALALDECPKGWHLEVQPRVFSKFMQTLLEEREADLSQAPDWVQSSAIPHRSGARLKISWQLGRPYADELPSSTRDHLVYLPERRITIGLGCARNCPSGYVTDLLHKAEQRLGIRFSHPAFASLDIKETEPAFAEIAPKMRFFSSTELQDIPVPNPSAVVQDEVGTPSVAEASALALAGEGATLVLEKIKNHKATLAVALAKNPLPEQETAWPGRPRAVLKIVGLGPGSPDLMAERALRALEEAQVWVGYGPYLDQARSMGAHGDPQLLAFALGGEEARCCAALDAAAKGQQVALICSGDPQVYAMAQVVYELVARHPGRLEWQGVHVETLPGITAMHALAAKVGAPLGHDFCAISLSDLNTPWEAIERKVQAAAYADFVIGFYNPRSQKRDWQLPRALEILRAHRPADCPVVFGRNVSRPDEAITVTHLSAFDPCAIDMFTCLIIGASFTRRYKETVYTPRGYQLS